MGKKKKKIMHGQHISNTFLRKNSRVSEKPVSVSGTAAAILSNLSCTLTDQEADSETDSEVSTEEAIAVTRNVPAPARQVFNESSVQPADLVLDGKTEYPPLNRQGGQAHLSSLFRNNSSQTKGFKLDLVELMGDDVVLENHEVDNLQQAWGHCLIGYFATVFPGECALLQLCNSWGVCVQVHVHLSGWIIFKFDNGMDSDLVLEGGPYFVFGRQLLMKPMPACFELDNEPIKFMPVWIKLPGLPLECWNARALSKITSGVGMPICTDMLTRTKERINFARVLVEVDASKELVRSIQIKLPVGKTRVQSVVFEYEPKFCSFCEVIGHVSRECTTNNQPSGDKAGQPQSKEPTVVLSGKFPVVEATDSGFVANERMQELGASGSRAGQMQCKEPTVFPSSKNTVVVYL